jgi:hypothetical protein
MRASQNGTVLHSLPQIPGTAIFYPVFSPETRHSGAQKPYLLVTAPIWNGAWSLSAAFQAGHAGSIPVARSLVTGAGLHLRGRYAISMTSMVLAEQS